MENMEKKEDKKSEAIWDNAEFVIKEVQRFGFSRLGKASARLLADKNFYLEIINKFDYGWILTFASDELKNDEEVVLAAIGKSGESPLMYASERLRGDKDFIKKVLKIRSDSGTYKHLSVALLDDEELFKMFFENDVSCYRFASERLREQKDNAKKALSLNGFFLRDAPEGIRDDKELVMLAIQMYIEVFRYASKRLKGDKDVVMAAMGARRCGGIGDLKILLNEVGEKLRSDEEVVLKAMENGHVDIGWASERIRNDFNGYLENESIECLRGSNLVQKSLSIMRHLLNKRRALEDAEVLEKAVGLESDDEMPGEQVIQSGRIDGKPQVGGDIEQLKNKSRAVLGKRKILRM